MPRAVQRGAVKTMAKRTMSPEARQRISESQKARWATFRANRGISTPMSLGARTSGKRGTKRRGRPPMSDNIIISSDSIGGGGVTMRSHSEGHSSNASHASRGGNSVTTEFGGQSIDQLIALRRKIDQELADRFVRDYAG